MFSSSLQFPVIKKKRISKTLYCVVKFHVALNKEIDVGSTSFCRRVIDVDSVATRIVSTLKHDCISDINFHTGKRTLI